MMRDTLWKIGLGLAVLVGAEVAILGTLWIAQTLLSIDVWALIVAGVVVILAWWIGDTSYALWKDKARHGWVDRRTLTEKVKALW